MTSLGISPPSPRPAPSSIQYSPSLEAPQGPRNGGILLNGDTSPSRASISLPFTSSADAPFGIGGGIGSGSGSGGAAGGGGGRPGLLVATGIGAGLAAAASIAGAGGTGIGGVSPISPGSTRSFNTAGSGSVSGRPKPGGSISGSGTGAGTGVTPRIRFAPLPDPRRPRSLSTGRNLHWTTEEDEAGNEVRHMEVRNVPQSAVRYDEEAVSDEEDDEEGGPGGGGGSEGEGRGKVKGGGRKWSKSMSSSWRVSKKILTVGLLDDSKEKEKETAYGGGMPLKKSVSTGGMIGSSPFRWTSVEERKRTMQGLSPDLPSASVDPTSPMSITSSLSAGSASGESGHRRMSSYDSPSAALGSSPQPVKLLNGRVYGARRASEIAEAQKKRREAAEPAFVEWGNGPRGASAAPASSLGSVAAAAGAGSGGGGVGGGRGLLGDNDDGSGMEWVKRRRAEREKAKREQEEKQRAAAAAAALVEEEEEHEDGGVPRLSSSESTDGSGNSDKDKEGEIVTPAIRTAELPPTPVIHVSEPLSPASEKGPGGAGLSMLSMSAPAAAGAPVGSGATRRAMGPATDKNVDMGSGERPGMVHETEKVEAVAIPVKTAGAGADGGARDVFDDDALTSSGGKGRGLKGVGRDEDEEEDEDESSEEEEEDDGDFEDDSEEEDEAVRTTSSAAGIEVVSRHHH